MGIVYVVMISPSGLAREVILLYSMSNSEEKTTSTKISIRVTKSSVKVVMLLRVCLLST